MQNMLNTMRNYIIYGICAAAALLLGGCASEELYEPQPDRRDEAPEYVKGELLVKFAPYVSDILDEIAPASRAGAPATRSGILSVDEVLDLIGTCRLERVFPIDTRTEARTREAELHLWYLVRFDAARSVEEVARELSALGEVQRVSYNQTIKRAYNTGRKATPLSQATLKAAATLSRAAGYPFDDELLPSQWHLINRGGFEGKSIAGADVQVEEAWKKSTGDPSIIVAVLDEGVMLTHPDLRDNIWINEDEEYGAKDDRNQAVDKDGNGYAGDRYGYNFVTNSGIITWDDVNDSGHGTHVAGIIAARNDNGIGISSIAGGRGQIPGVKIMSCQLFAGSKSVTSVEQARAIKYAADNGAVVLQCSWGYTSGLANPADWGSDGFDSQEMWEKYCPLEKSALDYFTHNAGSPNGPIEGGIAVFAGGNESAPMAGFPGAGEGYVAVSATAADYTPAVYTNYGPGTTIAAPGGDQDYYWDYKDETHNYGEIGCILSTLPPQVSDGTGYGFMEGTSMACPHVSGVVALGLSYAAEQRRHFTAEEFKALLYATATPIDPYLTGTKQYYRYVSDLGPNTAMQMVLNDYKGKMGVGQVNAARLLDAIDGNGMEMRFPNLYIKAGGSVSVIPAIYFHGGEQLTFTVQIAENSIASVRTDGAKLTFEGISVGATTATITASNGETHAFTVTVRNAASGNGWL